MLAEMQALLLSAPGLLEITDFPRPEPSADEVLVRVGACGICGSDVHGFTGETGRRVPPLVMGHEAAGTIAAIGPGVDGLTVGERVAIDSTVFCGHCAECDAGRENLCGQRQVLGVSCGDYRRQGCFAEYVVVPARGVYHLPEHVDFVAAALLEPLTIALHALNRGAVGPHTRTAVVVGCGMIGLAVIAALRARGVEAIGVIDRDPKRLSEATRQGATRTWQADVDVGQQAAAWAATIAGGGADGADVVVEAVGTTAAIQTAVTAAGRGESVVLVGNVSPMIDLPLQQVVTRQLRLLGSCASAGCYPEAIRLAATGHVDLTSFVSRVAPLAEGPTWFARLHRQEPGLVKVVLQP